MAGEQSNTVAIVIFHFAAIDVDFIAHMLLDTFFGAFLNAQSIRAESDEFLVDAHQVDDLLLASIIVGAQDIGIAFLVFLSDTRVPHDLHEGAVRIDVDHRSLIGARAVEVDFFRAGRGR